MTARTRTRGVRVHRDRGPRPPLRWHRRGGRAPPAWHRCGWQVRLRLRPLPVPAAASASASLSARLSPATRRTLNSESRQRLARQTLIPHAPACASGSGAAELACHRDAAGISGAGFRRSFKLRVGAAFTIHSILATRPRHMPDAAGGRPEPRPVQPVTAIRARLDASDPASHSLRISQTKQVAGVLPGQLHINVAQQLRRRGHGPRRPRPPLSSRPSPAAAAARATSSGWSGSVAGGRVRRPPQPHDVSDLTAARQRAAGRAPAPRSLWLESRDESAHDRRRVSDAGP
jgi:hypothetical protein